MMNWFTKKLKYIGYAAPLISLAILFYLWNTTSPVSIGPFGIFSVFVLLYIFWVSLFFSIISIISVISNKTYLSKLLKRRQEGARFHWQSAYYIATVAAFIPVLLLAMRSVNQLTLRDVVLVLVFAGLAAFYVIRRS